MDKELRNRIQRATQAARELLEQEYAEQLEGVFDIRPDGTIATEPGSHLDANQRIQRTKLVAAVEHLRSGGLKKDDAVAAYLREAAFTALNRFVALKMLEARGLLMPCVSHGDQSAGFKEFSGLAQGLVQLPDHGYRIYIESLFDEIGREVRVLFDRLDAASLLWPRRQALLDLLSILNAEDIAEIWGQDETIGWVYQFFNSGEERKKMRDESQAPRNSRELAVRNQFFTPRYVVQFLTDNTLGRTWFQMRGGKTALTSQCTYLVRDEAAAVPRALKDPRDIKILDPACGSGHFLLYAFDLLTVMYEEAWLDETAVRSQASSQSLRDDYQEREQLRKAVPGLILKHNLYGVDIDARCAQVAALALWLRAQRTFNELRLTAKDRPLITRSHIVVAEPMPGDAALLTAFAAGLQPPLLADLFKEMVNEMRLAGELGSLLRVEAGIARGLEKAHERFVEMMKAPASLPGFERQLIHRRLDLSGIDDERFFLEAEAQIVGALRDFAESAAGSAGVTRRLFAEDSAQGIALIDLVRMRFDVVLMNPPFGQPTEGTYEYLRSGYSGAHSDLFASFVRRGRELAPTGCVGAITSRAFLLSPRLEDFRKRYVLPTVELLADLGLGVMDNARVESAAFVLGRATEQPFVVLDCRRGRTVAPELLSSDRFASVGYKVDRGAIALLPQSKILYSLPKGIAQLLRDAPQFEPAIGTAREGMKSFENERFIRLAWEVRPDDIGRDRTWQRFAKGGAHSFFYAPLYLVLNWKESGAELLAVNEKLNGSTAQVRQASDYWYRPGVTYSKRSAKGFSARCLPAEAIFSSNGPAVLPTGSVDALTILGWLNSRPVRALLHLQSSFGDYSTGAIKRLPWTGLDGEPARRAVARTDELIRRLISLDQHSEISPLFVTPDLRSLGKAGEELRLKEQRDMDLLEREVFLSWDALVGRAFETEGAAWIDELLADPAGVDDAEGLGSHPSGAGDDEEERPTAADASTRAIDLVCWMVGVAIGRFDVRVATGDRPLSSLAGPFDALPICPKGFLTEGGGFPVEVAPSGYQLRLPEGGLMVDDPGHPSDLTGAVLAVFDVVFGAESDARLNEVTALLDTGKGDLRSWLARSFFEHHLKRHSQSRRKAPVVWQLATQSSSYSVWLHAHRLTGDSLFQVQNELVGPKLAREESKHLSLIQAAGQSPSPSQRREIVAQESLVGQLRVMFEDLKRVAPLYAPDLNDGVLLCMAPLWRLVPQHKSWQKELIKTWDEACEGAYDWAHMAMHLWPERVVPKCATDRSLAIAHGLEDFFWEKGDNGKWNPRTVDRTSIAKIVAERSSAAVKDALKGLLEAPGQATGGRVRGRKPRRHDRAAQTEDF